MPKLDAFTLCHRCLGPLAAISMLILTGGFLAAAEAEPHFNRKYVLVALEKSRTVLLRIDNRLDCDANGNAAY